MERGDKGKCKFTTVKYVQTPNFFIYVFLHKGVISK